jgi:hypothetical protein
MGDIPVQMHCNTPNNHCMLRYCNSTVASSSLPVLRHGRIRRRMIKVPKIVPTLSGILNGEVVVFVGWNLRWYNTVKEPLV